MKITVRTATREDAAAMANVLNPLIRAGGTTALETEMDASGMIAKVFDRAGFVACHIAEDGDGRIAGFQYVVRGDNPAGGYIATFARVDPKVPGVGRALFTVTRQAAIDAMLPATIAEIRADNTGGLAYYGKMGFTDHDEVKGVPLADGTPVDRIVKRLSL